jgi:hypothetical protein
MATIYHQNQYPVWVLNLEALIDCLREGLKESITIDDLYQYAFKRLKESSSQTPKKLGEQEGLPIEIGNFSKKLARLAEQERDQLISSAREKLNALVPWGALTEMEVEWWLRLLELGENISPQSRQSRDKLIRYLKGELNPLSVFGNKALPEPPLDALPEAKKSIRDNVISFLKGKLKYEKGKLKYEAFGTWQIPELPRKEPEIVRSVGPSSDDPPRRRSEPGTPLGRSGGLGSTEGANGEHAKRKTVSLFFRWTILSSGFILISNFIVNSSH